VKIIYYIKNKIFHPYGLLIIISFLSLSLNPYFTEIWTIDTLGYINVANNIFSISAQSRPPIFSFIIKVGNIIFNGNWILFLIILHWLIYLYLIILLWELLISYNINRLYIFAIISLFALSPRILFYKYVLLPEFLLGFIIFLVVFIAHKLIINNGHSLILKAILLGVLNALGCLTKPIWIFAGIITAIFFTYLYWNDRILRWKLPIIILASNFILIIIWQLFLFLNFKQINPSNASTRNLNLLSLRSGYYKNGEGTSLYDHIQDDPKLLNLAENLKWEDFDNFTELKGLLNNNITLSDEIFYNKTLTANLTDYILNQIRRLPAFYYSKCLSLVEEKHIPKIIKLYYLRLYKIIYLFIIPISFLAGFVGVLYFRNPLSILILLFITYYSLISVFVSYQNTSFVRFRVAIDLLLFIFPFVTLRPCFHKN